MMHPQISRSLLWVFAFTTMMTATVKSVSANEANSESKKLQVLLVAGGCCHDYSTQAKLLKEGIESRIDAEVTVALSTTANTKTTFEIYESDDWADGYDVVIHDECSANVTEKPYVNRILAAHQNGTPAVNLHCAMHSYRWGDFRSPVQPGSDNSAWYEMLGLQSTGHGPKFPIKVQHANGEHPITDGLDDWTTINEELYNNIRIFDGATALIQGKQMTPPNKNMLKKNPDAKPLEASAVVAWTNSYGPNKTRVFSTSLGHQNDTVADDRYLELVVRGLQWASNTLPPTGTAK
ncbi:Trehalose utilisation [Neorhodopirellula lusitana]|uniref:Trehalose utilisation n=1 Tax=Neorhodopirellula lusitana TaxID=445327 RepID=A0ABY1PVM9_9BACT|nr:ThuA domain-containing protein [Neorhodopirellula lusitana]SMP50396.1 Trehalose utilisation [Neorhodopirellula lusitana]